MIRRVLPALILGLVVQACQSPSSAQLCSYPEEGDHSHPIPAYNNLEDAHTCAQDNQKPLILWFSSWVSCTRNMDEKILSGDLLRNRLNQNFVIARLRVDDRTPLPENEWFTWEINDRSFEVNTLGRKNSHYQIERFQTNSQPYFAILTPDGKNLLGKFEYNTDSMYIDSVLTSALKKWEEINSP